jgi:chromosome segregation ATPase
MTPRFARKVRVNVESLARVVADQGVKISILTNQLRHAQACKSAAQHEANQWEKMARDANREIRKLHDERAEASRTIGKISAEVKFLYDELNATLRLTPPQRQMRVMQLAARREPEGRSYEGPEAT